MKCLSIKRLCRCSAGFAMVFLAVLSARAQTPPVTGACCLMNGQCEQRTRSDCAQAGGIYRGDNVSCDAVRCVARGACCLPSGFCVVTTQAGCTERHGTYHGDGVLCSATICPPPT